MAKAEAKRKVQVRIKQIGVRKRKAVLLKAAQMVRARRRYGSCVAMQAAARQMGLGDSTMLDEYEMLFAPTKVDLRKVGFRFTPAYWGDIWGRSGKNFRGILDWTEAKQCRILALLFFMHMQEA